MARLAMVFPGQGSQSVGMMNGYGELGSVKSVIAEASEVLKQDIGKLMAEGPAEELNRTVNTQPVMVTAAYAAYRAWKELGGAEPQIVAGHSLGEYTALVVAGRHDFRRLPAAGAPACAGDAGSGPAGHGGDGGDSGPGRGCGAQCLRGSSAG